MSDTYSISGKFDGANQIVSDFKRIEEQVRNVTKALKENQAASNFKVPSQTRASNRQLQTTNRQALTAQQQQQSLLRQQTAEIHKQTEKYQGYINAGREAGRIVREQVSYMRELTTETVELSKAQEKFKTIGLSASENEKAFKAVKDTVKDVRGLNVAEMTETITDLHTAFGSLEHAIENLKTAGKYSFSFQSLFGDKFSKEQIETQIQAGYKYLEVTGAVAKGQAEVDKRFNALAQVTAATAGRVTPADMLQMARRAGPSAQGLSVAGMRNVAALIPELGAEGTGTALMSLYQAFVGNKLAHQGAAEEFARLGLLDKSKLVYGKAGQIKKILPEANKLATLMQEDPLNAADMLMKAMEKPLSGKAIDTSNMDKVRGELAILFGNRTAQKLMSLLTTQRGQIIKEAHIIAGSKNIEEMYEQALDSPMGKMLEFENAVANFKTEVGKPLLEAFTGAAQAAKPFIQLMAEYPKVALMALMMGKLGTNVASAAIEIRSFMALRSLALAAQTTGAGVTPQIGAGASSAGGAGLLGGMSAATATGIGTMVAMAVMSIYRVLDNKENEAAAASAGERLGLALQKRFSEQIQGMSEDVRKEFDKSTAPQMAEDLIKLQQLSTGESRAGGFWQQLENRILLRAESPFVYKLGASASERSKPGSMDKEYIGNARNQIKSNLATSISSPEQLSEYLSQARKMFESQGRPELARELELLAAQALPQFADKVAATVAVQEQATQAVGTFTNALSIAAMQISYLNFANTGNAGMPLTPGMGRSIISPPKSSFNTGKPFSFGRFAKGGVIERPTLALMGEGAEPEAVAPLSKLSKLVTAGRGGRGVRDIHIPVTIYGDAPVGMASRIASAVKAGLEEHLERILTEQENDYDLTAV